MLIHLQAKPCRRGASAIDIVLPHIATCASQPTSSGCRCAFQPCLSGCGRICRRGTAPRKPLLVLRSLPASASQPCLSGRMSISRQSFAAEEPLLMPLFFYRFLPHLLCLPLGALLNLVCLVVGPSPGRTLQQGSPCCCHCLAAYPACPAKRAPCSAPWLS